MTKDASKLKLPSIPNTENKTERIKQLRRNIKGSYKIVDGTIVSDMKRRRNNSSLEKEKAPNKKKSKRRVRSINRSADAKGQITLPDIESIQNEEDEFEGTNTAMTDNRNDMLTIKQKEFNEDIKEEN